jgi:hypothetical protein
LLDRAAQWPGTMPLAGGTHRLVSDAFTTYLAGQPECSSPG